MFRKLAFSVLVVAVLGILVAPAHSATDVFEHQWNFDASDVGVNPLFYVLGTTNQLAFTSTFTAGANTHLPSGDTVRILGPFANDGFSAPIALQTQGVHVTVGTASDTYDGVSISFQLWAINTWDGNDTNPDLGPDYFQVGVSSGNASALVAPATACAGTGVALCETFQNGTGTQSFPGAPTYNGYQQGSGSFGNTIAANGYSLYDITLTELPVTPTGGQITIYFRGWQNQSSADESWAIGNLTVTTHLLGSGPGPIDPDPGAIPEPSTFVLGGLGLAFIAFASRRYRRA